MTFLEEWVFQNKVFKLHLLAGERHAYLVGIFEPGNNIYVVTDVGLY